MFRSAALNWKQNAASLGDIDSRFGNGDHGLTIEKMAALTLERLDDWEDESIKDFFEDLSMSFMSLSGGSAGVLYGTLVEGLAEPLADETEIDAATLKAMLASTRESLFEITKARVGDKTMMDALIPAVDAACQAENDVVRILQAASEAALQGARDTANMVAKFGRARNYGEKTLGTPDAGATSTELLFEGFLHGIESNFEKSRVELKEVPV
jgi:dihydroxyacetone kinase-like protein